MVPGQEQGAADLEGGTEVLGAAIRVAPAPTRADAERRVLLRDDPRSSSSWPGSTGCSSPPSTRPTGASSSR